jgi:hypothetical protein
LTDDCGLDLGLDVWIKSPFLRMGLRCAEESPAGRIGARFSFLLAARLPFFFFSIDEGRIYHDGRGLMMDAIMGYSGKRIFF